MSVKVLTTRRLPHLVNEMEAELLPQLDLLLIELRSLAFRQPGYISGETMRNVNDSGEFLVISTWKSTEDWQRWFENKDREALEAKIHVVLGSQTEFKVYAYD
ncbi:antibiotic biosynthesis monooxygenase [bacterium]|nr:antibiotic biosynthesis monooxygenase [bacterium]